MFYAFEALGTVVAFISGGFLLRLYTHFDTVDVSTSVYTLDSHMLKAYINHFCYSVCDLSVTTRQHVAYIFIRYVEAAHADHIYRSSSTYSIGIQAVEEGHYEEGPDNAG